MQHPQSTHWVALRRLLRYLQGTMHFGIQLHRSNPLQLHAFCDADWAGAHESYISTTGYLVYLGKNPVAWSSKKQRPLPYLLPKLSSVLLLIRLLKFYGSILFFWSLALRLLLLRPSIVTTWVLQHILLTRFFTLVWNMHVALAFYFVREHVRPVPSCCSH